MKFIQGHIRAFGGLFAFAFFLASSGFTVVLYHCTMGDMSSCAYSDTCMPTEREAPEHQRPANMLVTPVENLCHTVSIAGGLHTDPSIVEKESSAKHIKVEFVLAPLSDCVCTSLFDHLPQLLGINTSNVSPPSVETYVLNSSFLI